MIVEITNYFAAPDNQKAVLAQRRKASKLRAELGLPEGEIFIRQGDKGPDVRWECRFENQAAFEADLAARRQSPEFENARKTMHTLLDRFERHIFERDEG
ncbi:hypothetical protein [Cucumibacter marinus]|uniref:hypothetical protein n=1 Tax=Cucumibacter marinus TaxID=1121252 RepID=UPI000423DDF6|nr:hypothetical protein [Cucumibacter marinus]